MANSTLNAVARDLLHRPAVTASPDTTAADAARLMLESQLKVLPVTDAHGRLVGVADRADVLRALGST